MDKDKVLREIAEIYSNIEKQVRLMEKINCNGIDCCGCAMNWLKGINCKDLVDGFKKDV